MIGMEMTSGDVSELFVANVIETGVSVPSLYKVIRKTGVKKSSPKTSYHHTNACLSSALLLKKFRSACMAADSSTSETAKGSII